MTYKHCIMFRDDVYSRSLALTVFLLLFCALDTSSAQRHGFISIDCGGSSNYTDPLTGINWVTDDGFVATGKTEVVVSNLAAGTNIAGLKTSRCFPTTTSGSRKKNCYTLPVASGDIYLLRIMFFHGPMERGSLSFDISLDSTYLSTVRITKDSSDLLLWGEVTLTAQSDQVFLCLQDIDQGTPCIATIELRPVGDGYKPLMQKNNLLGVIRRYSFGLVLTGDPIRYPDDEYDRLWEQQDSGGIYNISTTLSLSQEAMTAFKADRIPLTVLQKAWERQKITFAGDTIKFLSVTSTFILKLYVWDFVPYTNNDTDAIRRFDTFVVRSPVSDELLFTTTLNASNTADISIIKIENVTNDLTSITLMSSNSTSSLVPSRPPLLNAIEMFADIPRQQPADEDDVSAIMDLQKDYGLSPPWVGDPCLPTSWEWITCDIKITPARVTGITLDSMGLSGSISPIIWRLTELTNLSLSNNNLSGTIPDEISVLKKLRILHLYNNSLTGLVPTSLGALPELRQLYIYNNSLSGTIPPFLLNNSNLEIKASGNRNLLCDGTCNTKRLEGLKSSGDSKGNVGFIVGAVCGSVVIGLIALGAFFCFFLRLRPRPSRKYNEADNEEKNDLSSIGLFADPMQRAAESVAAEGTVRSFSLAEIKGATKNFHTMIAEGGFGPVYYGKLADGQEVAVKVHKATSHQGAQEFFSEVNLLSRVHHRNLVALVGHCQESQQQILVYAYMRKGTLRDHLYGGARRTSLDWRTRLEIALDSARGITYLHTACEPPIIHRDIKTNNILMDDKLKAKVADFGISKITSEGETGVDTLVKGTTGYLDPEYYRTERLTQKSDVFSFGVVLLEIITGRPPISNEGHLKDWFSNRLRDNDIKAAVDPSLDGDYYIEAMWKMAELAMSCVRSDSADRPDMVTVMKELTEAMELERSVRLRQQPSANGRGSSLGSTSSIGPKGRRNSSDQLKSAPSFRPHSSPILGPPSMDFVSGLIPR